MKLISKLFTKNKVLVLLLCLPVPAEAADKWQDRLEIYGYAILAVDYLQTRDIMTNDSVYEMNPILGRKPEMSRLNTVFATQMLLHYSLQDTVYRKTWNWTVAITHTLAAIQNRRLNVSIKF
jgi:hypothetical protein